MCTSTKAAKPSSDRSTPEPRGDRDLRQKSLDNPTQPPSSTLPDRMCGAKTRKGTPCRSLSVRGRRRCRMHGGTNPGAPKGNKNAQKHGFYSAAAVAARLQNRLLLRFMRQQEKERL